ncbi:MAG: hypothetical protein QOI13_1382 [Paraburkholderia sp.]|nr:hypothetical protein [Paraburkholderia sp.]
MVSNLFRDESDIRFFSQPEIFGGDAKERHVARAAVRLGMAPPPLSQQIRNSSANSAWMIEFSHDELEPEMSRQAQRELDMVATVSVLEAPDADELLTASPTPPTARFCAATRASAA